MSAIAQLAPPTRPVCDDHPLAQVHQLLLFQRPGPVLVFWIKSPPFIGTSLVLKTGETLIDHLVGTDDNGGGVVDRFIDEINDAIRAGKPASIIAIKDRVLEKTIGYFEQTCASRRPAHVVLALTLLVDFIRSIDQITEAVLSSSRKEIAVRLSTATAGPRYRNDAPRATPLAGADEAGVKEEKFRRPLPFRNSSHPAPDAPSDDAVDAEPSKHTARLKTRLYTPFCNYTPNRLVFAHQGTRLPVNSITSARIANIFRTTAVAVDELIDRSLAELKERLGAEGYGLEDLQDAFAH